MFYRLCCLAIFAICFSVAASAPVASAQFTSATNDGSAFSISPRFPEPNETVTIELNDFSINTAGASYTWFINGTEYVAAKNLRSIQIPAGTAGERTTVVARTRLANGATLETKTTIAPIRVDMLIEADTIVPAFYAGRSLPSSGSTVRVTAIPFADSSRSPSTYSYTWRVGSTVVGGSSIYGKNSVTFSSGFERTVQVSVDIIDSAGNLLTTEQVNVPISDPELHFYEVDPLSGLLERAIDDTYIFTNEETIFRAEPYYMDRALMANRPYTEWKLNGETIANPNSNQQEIVLRRSGQQGNFVLSYHVRNLRQLLQGVEDSVSIKF